MGANPTSCYSGTNHAVMAVGFDAGSYWKIRNSWGTGWGEAGYIRVTQSSSCSTGPRQSLDVHRSTHNCLLSMLLFDLTGSCLSLLTQQTTQLGERQPIFICLWISMICMVFIFVACNLKPRSEWTE